ncbi:unnamed protein product [Paramecium octaurelia]|uniref:Kinesin motor domain-containing protein n=1 Tax=Paramecium octaurelia TaxID=43137 RepID=A0A8S1SAZ3_PAROT|nr:unnamed protein product [Paramecium octaurelia]
MSVKVAVRVRPFNKFEIEQNLPLCISMKGDKTILFDSTHKKEFEFDYSFWSHDEFEVDEKGYRRPLPNSRYADQKMIFNTIHQDTIAQLFQGQNCCILSFGQKLSGRSYTLLGTAENQGLVQNFVKEIFQQIAEKQNITTKYEVYTSMLFTFNEIIYDQLSPTDGRDLKIKENALQGVFVENLTKELVDSPESFDELMKKGILKLQKCQTLMSVLVSYANIIIQLEIKETITLDDQKLENLKLINFVDLVCSDRIEKLKDSKYQYLDAKIARPLSTLLEVICKVLLLSQQQDKKIIVPYRDSKLTRILQKTLNQKSNIFLYLSISPAINNFQQSLSTLKFANKIMKIKNDIISNIKASENQQILDLSEAQIQTQSQIIQSSIKQEFENKQEQELNRNTQYIQQFDKSEKIQSDTNIRCQAIISTKDGIIELQPLSQESCGQIFINNHQVKELTKLYHGDRVSFGNTTSLLIQYNGIEKPKIESNLTLIQKDTLDESENNQIIEEQNKSLKFDQD